MTHCGCVFFVPYVTYIECYTLIGKEPACIESVSIRCCFGRNSEPLMSENLELYHRQKDPIWFLFTGSADCFQLQVSFVIPLTFIGANMHQPTSAANLP